MTQNVIWAARPDEEVYHVVATYRDGILPNTSCGIRTKDKDWVLLGSRRDVAFCSACFRNTLSSFSGWVLEYPGLKNYHYVPSGNKSLCGISSDHWYLARPDHSVNYGANCPICREIKQGYPVDDAW